MWHSKKVRVQQSTYAYMREGRTLYIDSYSVHTRRAYAVAVHCGKSQATLCTYVSNAEEGITAPNGMRCTAYPARLHETKIVFRENVPYEDKVEAPAI